MSKLIILFSGFMQPEKLSNGCRALIQSIKEDRRFQQGDAGEYYRWGQDVMEDERQKFDGRRVFLGGHSFGGHAAVKLAEVLWLKGIGVEALFLCDAVHQGMTRAQRGQTILIPKNVGSVYVWKKKKGLPEASPIKTYPGERQLREEHLGIPVGHAAMDEQLNFQATVKRVFFTGG